MLRNDRGVVIDARRVVMIRPRSVPLFAAVMACGLGLSAAVPASAAEWKFQLSFDPQVHPEPFTGRVYVIFSKRDQEPRRGPHWFGTEPFVSLDVTDWKPGEPFTIDTRTPGILSFPKQLSELSLAEYRAQAVARFNPWEREIGRGPGNGFSDPLVIKAPGEDLPVPHFKIDRLVPDERFVETEWVKLLEVPSKLLSEFHHREVALRGSVRLPASYFDAPERRYPVIFTIPGFGGTHEVGRKDQPVPEENAERVEFLRVTLDPSCPLGHHVFADSQNNGPVGTALVQEFLPELDRKFRTIAAPTARFLTGHSSGGWSSLWLQVTYPDAFGGVWSTAPDPVDFRDFQRIDLYRPGENMYRDERGERRPIAHRGDQVLIWYDDFAKMEWVLGYGGQLLSFEAVFSPRGPDGKPLLVFDRETGEVQTDVARTWEKYDIRLILEQSWQTMGPRLAGKLHIFMGDADTFYLEGATKLLKQSLADLKSDAVVEIVSGKDHSTLLDAELIARMRREIVEQYLKRHGKGK